MTENSNNLKNINYTILLFPDLETNEIIEQFRIKNTGTGLVDSLPPHITLKRRFVLNDNFSEDELVEVFKEQHFVKLNINFAKTEKLGDALVWVGESAELKKLHSSIVKILEGFTKTKNPEWEKENYKIHLTLQRGGEYSDVPEIKQITLKRVGLYEIDSNRGYAVELYSVNL